MEININSLYDSFNAEKHKYTKIWEYYKGKTDIKKHYRKTERSNLVANCNYLKKFVKEEVSYSVGNPISYKSSGNDSRALAVIEQIHQNFNENHDYDAFLNMVLFGVGYEIYYVDRWGELQTRPVSPLEGIGLEDEDGLLSCFMRVYSKQELVGSSVEWVEYANLYTADRIDTFKKQGEYFELITSEPHYWGECPVGYAKLSNLKSGDTLFSDIKELQDCLENVLSDLVNEISDFRSAYLIISGMVLDDDENMQTIKEKGIIEVPTPEGDVKFLTKEINDSFTQNTLEVLQEKLYEMSSHINTNDSEQMSNASGVALKCRLISLMQRCKSNQCAFAELLKTRIRIISIFSNLTGRGTFDWRDIKVHFSPNIPADDNSNASLVNQLSGVVSNETLLGLLSFVENPTLEAEKVQAELEVYKENNPDEFEREEDK